jgi:hypothetical protein
MHGIRISDNNSNNEPSMPAQNISDEERVFGALKKHGVPFIIIGGHAPARLTDTSWRSRPATRQPLQVVQKRDEVYPLCWFVTRQLLAKFSQSNNRNQGDGEK